LPKFAKKNLLGDAAASPASPAPTALFIMMIFKLTVHKATDKHYLVTKRKTKLKQKSVNLQHYINKGPTR